jgi:undecaprenyl-diphosphatase
MTATRSAHAPAALETARTLVPREGRILLIALGVVASLWIFLAVAGLMTSGRTEGFDGAILRAFRRADDARVPIGPRWCELAALELTALGSGTVLTTITLAVAGYLVIERRFAMTALMLLATVGGMVLSLVLKEIFVRPRPTVVPPLALVHSTSFPSGHSMSAAVVYLTLGALLARTTPRWRLRLYYLGTALFLSFAIGLTRVYLGVHYPTDVIAGWVAGVLWALVCELIAQLLQRRGVVTPPAG